MTLKEKIERLKTLQARCAELVTKDKTDDGLTDEETREWDEGLDEIETLDAEIRTAQDAERGDARRERSRLAGEIKIAPIGNPRVGRDPIANPKADADARAEITDLDRTRAMNAWLRGGQHGPDLTVSDREVAHRVGINLDHRSLEIFSPEAMEHRAQSVGTDSEGGFTAPDGFMAEIVKSRKAFGGVREISRVVPTSTGNPLPWPTVDGTAQSTALTAENAAIATVDVVFGSKTLNAFKHTSKILVSLELLQDTGINLVQIIGELLGERSARRENIWLTVGTGSGQPNGVVTASVTGKVAASGTAIVFDEIKDMVRSVDPAYRTGARWMMSDATLGLLDKLKDSNGRYLLQDSVADGEPMRLGGFPVVINQDVPAVAVNNDVIAFGDFSKYIVRDVLGVMIQRLDELHADNGQVGFNVSARVDGELLDAGAVKVLTMGAV